MPIRSARCKGIRWTALAQKARTGVDAKLVDFEFLHKSKLIYAELAQARKRAKPALLARSYVVIRTIVSYDHASSAGILRTHPDCQEASSAQAKKSQQPVSFLNAAPVNS